MVRAEVRGSNRKVVSTSMSRNGVGGGGGAGEGEDDGEQQGVGGSSIQL